MPRQPDPKRSPVSLTLSDGTNIKIGSIRWRSGWVPAKNLILDTLKAGSVQRALRRLFQTLFSDGATGAEDFQEEAKNRLLQLVESSETLDELVQLVPEALFEVSEKWDELTEILIPACVEPDQHGEVPSVDLDSLTMQDVSELRDAVNEVNDWNELFNMEKNSLAGVFGSLLRNTSDGKQNGLSPDGGLIGNPSSSEEDSTSATLPT